MSSPLDSLLPGTRQRVLAATLMHPDRWWFVRDMARHLGVAPSNAHRELKALSLAGILQRREEGTQVYFRANQACPVYPELRGLVRKTVGLLSVLEEALGSLSARILVAFVHGSFARGDETAESDVDLLVIGDVSLGEVSRVLSRVEAELLREVNPTVFSQAEFRRRIAKGDHFLTSVLGEEKLFVLGTADELEGAVG